MLGRRDCLSRIERAAADETGGVLALFALWIPVVILMMTFVVDVGNWFQHKRHLQLQADAAAFAGGGAFTFPCSDAAIEAAVQKYGGDLKNDATAYNAQIGGSNQGDVTLLMNSQNYAVGGDGPDDTNTGDPCTSGMIDVKITEADLPWFFKLAGSLVGSINAHARVEIKKIQLLGDTLPVGVPDPTPKAARVELVDLDSGNVLPCAGGPCSKLMVETGTDADGLHIWDNSADQFSLTVGAPRIGVRVILSGNASTTTCGARLVECYQQVLFLRGYGSDTRSSATDPPVLRNLYLAPGTGAACADPYFSDPAATCSVRLVADISSLPVSSADMQFLAYGGNCPNGGCELTQVGTSTIWDANITVSPSQGVQPITLEWRQKGGGSVTPYGSCSNNFNSTDCHDFFLGAGNSVHQTYTAGFDFSGPIEKAGIYEAGIQRAEYAYPLSSSQTFYVKVAVAGSLANAQTPSDPLVSLRVTHGENGGASQTQSIDCDPGAGTNIRQEIANGCVPDYIINTAATCTSPFDTGPNTSWPTSPPGEWPCVATQTGGATGQVEQGLADRINGGSTSTCLNPSHWGDYWSGTGTADDPYSFTPDPTDPRLVPVFLTPYGTFAGSGNDVFPVINFGSFYIRGWRGDPCPAPPDITTDPEGHNLDKGEIVGNFFKFVDHLGRGAGSEGCVATEFGSCVAVLTR